MGTTLRTMGPGDAGQFALQLPEQGRATTDLDTTVDSIRSRRGDRSVACASLLDDPGGLPVLARRSALDA